MINKPCIACNLPLNGGVYRKPNECPHCSALQNTVLSADGKTANRPAALKTAGSAKPKPKTKANPLVKKTVQAQPALAVKAKTAPAAAKTTNTIAKKASVPVLSKEEQIARKRAIARAKAIAAKKAAMKAQGTAPKTTPVKKSSNAKVVAGTKKSPASNSLHESKGPSMKPTSKKPNPFLMSEAERSVILSRSL